jgi:hypothetical protein
MNRLPKTSAPLPRNAAIATRALRCHRAFALWSANAAVVAYLLHF